MLSKFDTAETTRGFRPRPMTPEAIDQLVYDELRVGSPRSAAYRQGVRDLLRTKLLGATLTRSFEEGTAESDAYFAGVDRGHIILRTLAPEERKHS